MKEHETYIYEWKKNKEARYDAAYQVVRNTPSTPENIAKVRELHDTVFGAIDCLACANCCKTTPALITKRDAKRIASKLQMPPKTFLRKYTIEDINGEYIMNRVPCPFLLEDNRCDIYDVRPEACSRFPHTDEEAFFNRARLNAENTIVCPAAYHIVQKLNTAL